MRRALVLSFWAIAARGVESTPPWIEPGDVPIPSWVKSVAPKKDDTAIFFAPGRTDQKRGTLHADAVRLPIFGAKRGAECQGRWLEIGPLAWVCSDLAELSADPPGAIGRPPGADGLPYRYYFVGKSGAQGFGVLSHIEDDTPDFELEPGFFIATVADVEIRRERFARTRRGGLVRVKDIAPARPSAFQGALLSGGKLDMGWVVVDRTSVWEGIGPQKKNVGSRTRFESVPVREQKPPWTRISDDGAKPLWIAAKDIAVPSIAQPPPEARAGERWIDVELATQTLVAYEGTEPVYATIVSTGKPGVDTVTPKGTHRIWVKLESSDMDNLDADIPDTDKRFSIEDVPYVQFFDKAIGLHAAFWHAGFGHTRSHGCVNLAPLDAAWLFRFTTPHLPAGWAAVLPTSLDLGTPIRVR